MSNVKLSDVIKSYCIRKNDPNLNRAARFYELALDILQELALDITAEPTSIQLPIDKIGECNIPPDFINYISVSLIGGNGELLGLSQNNFINTIPYFNNCGQPVRNTGNESNVTGTFYQGWVNNSSFLANHWRNGENIGAYFNAPNVNPNGTYRFDFTRNKIILAGMAVGIGDNSDVENSEGFPRSIVLEYISDLRSCDKDYLIHPFILETLKKGIMYIDMEVDRNFSEGAKQRAKLNYELEKKRSIHRYMCGTRAEWLQSMRGTNQATTKW